MKNITNSHSVRRATLVCALMVLGASVQAGHPSSVAISDPSAKMAHDAYVKSINGNNVDEFMSMVTDDVVMLPPNEKAVVGKKAVREWAEEYFKAYKSHWDKTQTEFVQAGDWAFEQYAYQQLDKPVAGGADVTDIGKALLVFHHDADGKWRVARDAWNTDLAAKP